MKQHGSTDTVRELLLLFTCYPMCFALFLYVFSRA